MTEGQRDYLADLASQKGTVLENTDDVSAAWASAKIEELKSMPDATFAAVSEELGNHIKNVTDGIINEVSKWNFQA